MIKIIYFGTPPFAGQILKFLIDHNVTIVAIVTQPDRPQGRKLQLTPPAVKQIATQLAADIPILQPEKASDPNFLDKLESFGADLFVVVAYGQILSKRLLAIPPLGSINVHASLLPKYRGAAPIQRSLMNGDQETGISIQKMVFQLDAGDVIEEAKIKIDPDLNFGALELALCDLSKMLLLSILIQYSQGIPSASPQDESQVTFAPKIKPEEIEIRWNKPAEFLHNQIRALSPRPGAWCWIEVGMERKRLKILCAKKCSESGHPGEVLFFRNDRCIIAAQSGSLQLQQVQPEGKKAMAIADWIRGCPTLPKFCSN